MGVLKKIILVVLLAYFANIAFKIISVLNFNKIIYFHEPGQCHLVPGVDEGSEDIQVLKNGIALITSGLKVPMPAGSKYTKHRKGRILKFDFNDPDAGTEEVKIVNADEMLDLNPHGISLWEDDKTGHIRVFVVNHPIKDDMDYICIFDYDLKTNTLRHVKSVTTPDFGLQNDVVATGPDSFYTTAYSASRNSQLLQLAEALYPLGSVVYYNGKDSTKVETGLLSPNGINISPDGKHLYLAISMSRLLRIYKRNADNTVSYIRDIPLDTVPDNIGIDPNNGDLWIGAHPIGYQLMSHVENPVEGAPSQVLRIRIKGDTQFIEEVLVEPSSRIFGSSIAERYKDAILVGTIQHKMLYCHLQHISKIE